ncbi:hypothetical protein PHYSODRAFT_521432, partial [Phytophthora sojae]
MDCIPRVTFLGPKEQWRVEQHRFQNLFSVPEDAIFRWLSVLEKTHSYWLEEGISIDSSWCRRAALRELEKQIRENVVVEASD